MANYIKPIRYKKVGLVNDKYYTIARGLIGQYNSLLQNNGIAFSGYNKSYKFSDGTVININRVNNDITATIIGTGGCIDWLLKGIYIATGNSSSSNKGQYKLNISSYPFELTYAAFPVQPKYFITDEVFKYTIKRDPGLVKTKGGKHVLTAHYTMTYADNRLLVTFNAVGILKSPSFYYDAVYTDDIVPSSDNRTDDPCFAALVSPNGSADPYAFFAGINAIRYTPVNDNYYEDAVLSLFIHKQPVQNYCLPTLKSYPSENNIESTTWFDTITNFYDYNVKVTNNVGFLAYNNLVFSPTSMNRFTSLFNFYPNPKDGFVKVVTTLNKSYGYYITSSDSSASTLDDIYHREYLGIGHNYFCEHVLQFIYDYKNTGVNGKPVVRDIISEYTSDTPTLFSIGSTTPFSYEYYASSGYVTKPFCYDPTLTLYTEVDVQRSVTTKSYTYTLPAQTPAPYSFTQRTYYKDGIELNYKVTVAMVYGSCVFSGSQEDTTYVSGRTDYHTIKDINKNPTTKNVQYDFEYIENGVKKTQSINGFYTCSGTTSSETFTSNVDSVYPVSWRYNEDIYEDVQYPKILSVDLSSGTVVYQLFTFKYARNRYFFHQVLGLNDSTIDSTQTETVTLKSEVFLLKNGVTTLLQSKILADRVDRDISDNSDFDGTPGYWTKLESRYFNNQYYYFIAGDVYYPFPVYFIRVMTTIEYHDGMPSELNYPDYYYFDVLQVKDGVMFRYDNTFHSHSLVCGTVSSISSLSDHNYPVLNEDLGLFCLGAQHTTVVNVPDKPEVDTIKTFGVPGVLDNIYDNKLAGRYVCYFAEDIPTTDDAGNTVIRNVVVLTRWFRVGGGTYQLFSEDIILGNPLDLSVMEALYLGYAFNEPNRSIYIYIDGILVPENQLPIELLQDVQNDGTLHKKAWYSILEGII